MLVLPISDLQKSETVMPKYRMTHTGVDAYLHPSVQAKNLDSKPWRCMVKSQFRSLLFSQN